MENQEKKPLMSKCNQRSNNYSSKNSSVSSSDRSRSDDGDDWSDDYSGSYCSDSDSSVPEWDGNVKDNGELVYIVCSMKKDSNRIIDNNDSIVPAGKTEPTSNNNGLQRNGFTRQSVRRSSRGKILKLLKRHNSAKGKWKSGNSNESHANKSSVNNDLSAGSGKVTFTESEDGEVKEVVMEVNFANKLRYGRRINQIEALFGISVTTFDDGKRIMVSGIIPESQAISRKQIKIGDWLKMLDNENVTAHNIVDVINSYPEEKVSVKLVLQRVDAKEITSDVLDHSKIQCSDTVRYLTDINSEHELVLSQILRDLPVAVVYLTSEGISENSREFDGVLYCYPRPEKHNFLCNSRGTFLTLNHLVPEISKQSKPISTTVYAKECYINISYTSRGNELLLLALPHTKCNLFELKYINEELVRMLEFTYQSLGKCFKNTSYVEKLDHLFSRLFSQILTCGYGWDNQRSVRIEKIRQLSEVGSIPLFEQCLPLAQELNIPWEAHLQIDDALTELEAADYREFNDDPFDCQRLFVVIGSCLYYAGHLLVSHFQDSDMLDIHSFLRLQGFLSLSQDEDIQNMIVWKEVFVNSSNRGLDQQEDELDNNINGDANFYKIPFGRWFIVIIGKGKFLLITILEAGISTVKAEGTIFPEPFYVEECESCLDLLIDVGLDKFLHQWIFCNARPQVVTAPEQLFPAGKFGKDLTSLAAAFTKKTPSPIHRKSPEIQSILKRAHHSSDQLNTASSSLLGIDDSLNSTTFSQSNFGNHWIKLQTGHALSMTNLDVTYSDESSSQRSNSEVSEDRIEGRRVLREREDRQNKNSLSSDSDGEWGEDNSQYSGGYDMSDLSQSLLEKMDLVLPTKISAGISNTCFHFVKLDSEKGVLMAPSLNIQTQSDSILYKHILTNFRRASQKIHTLLQNTIRFKKMLSPSSSVNKSLVAIKEHGILFDVPAQLLSSLSSTSKRSNEGLTYWVVGRLFENNQSSEVYVCYQDSVPQNIVEIAFRLGLNY